MKKTLHHVFAVVFAVLGLVFILVPGPSLIFFIAALFLLAFYYPWARTYLTKCQALFKASCVAIDKALSRR